MQKRPDIVPVILAGGAGSRLRPLTGPKRPKPFLRLFSDYSLFQETVRRAGAARQPIVVCHQDFGAQAAVELEEIGVTPRAIIMEPEARNTAAAVAAAAFYLKNLGSAQETLMLVMPSDHYLPDAQAFERAVMRAAASAASGMIMMIGVKPRKADPRFGYIEARSAGYMAGVEQFIEKPDLETAKDLMQGGKCCWNTGVFMVRPGVYLTELARQEPEIYKALDVACQAGKQQEDFFVPAKSSFVKAPSTSVDYAVLEGCAKAGLVMLDSPWDDIGTWPSLLRLKFSLLRTKNTAHDGRERDSKARHAKLTHG